MLKVFGPTSPLLLSKQLLKLNKKSVTYFFDIQSFLVTKLNVSEILVSGLKPVSMAGNRIASSR